MSGECCPLFTLEKWDEKTHEWENKKFIMESVPTLFHIPFPPMIGKSIGRMCRLAEEAEAIDENKSDTLVLFHDPSAFRSEMYLQVTRDVRGANNVTLSGTFVSKVFDGPYNAAPKFIKEMDSYLKGRGQVAEDYYVHYAYCPKCAKTHGHNYAVFFAKIKNN